MHRRQRPQAKPRLTSIALHLARAFAAVQVICPLTAWSQAITPDGRTATTLGVAGAVTNVHTGTVRGANAFNSFYTFDVGAGQTVNLHLPGATANLINMVRDQRTTVDGTLNSIRNGGIGGNVYFANPHGFLVSANGVVNVGSLNVTTPTQGFVDGFFTAPNTPDEMAVSRLLSGTAPRHGSGVIAINGRVNAADGVVLSAGAIKVGGAVYSGARFVSETPHFTDVVNANGLRTGTRIVEHEGKITIVADTDVGISGTLSADGASGVNGGEITVRAGNDVALNAGADVSAHGVGENSSGGKVTIWGESDATIHEGARVSADAGVTGDGGFVEFSAKNNVILNGGRMSAEATVGRAGTVLIDPTTLTGSGADYFSATNYVLTASDSITLSDVVIATRNVAVADQNRTNIDAAPSVGDSGGITLTAPNISLNTGTKLLAHATTGSTAGDITLTAEQSDHMAGFRAVQANTKIDVNGATLKGRNVTLTATSDAGYDWAGDPLEVATRAVSDPVFGSLLFGLTGFNIGVAISNATSEVLVKSGSTIEAQGSGGTRGSVELISDTSSKAEHFKLGLELLTQRFSLTGSVINAGFVWGEANATATVDVASGASIKAGTLNMSATNHATTDLTVIGVSKDTTVNAAGVVNKATVQSAANIATGATIDVDNSVAILAHNQNQFTSSATSMALGSGKVGIAVNYTELNTGATASNSTNLLGTGLANVKVEALNDTVKNKSAASTSAGSSAIAAAIIEPVLGLADSGMNKLLGKVEAGPQEVDSVGGGGKPKIGAAVTYADNTHNATAFIGNSAQVNAAQDVVVAAKVNDQRIRTHATASAEGKKDDPHNPGVSLGLGGAVAVGLFKHNVNAYIDDNATVTAQHVGVASALSVPYEITWAKWEGASTIFSKLNSNLGIGDGLLSGWSNASVGGCVGACLAGSVTWIDFDNTSDAYLGRSAKVNIAPGGADAWSADLTGDSSAFVGTNNTTIPAVRTQAFESPLHLLAESDVQGVYVAGNMSLLVNGVGGEPGAGAAGGGYNQVNFDTATRAWISEGAVIQQSAGLAVNVTVQADATTQITAVTPSAGRGASYGASIILSRVTVNDTTDASIDDEAQVTGARVDVKAEENEIAWSLSGAINKSESAGVGAGVAINDITTDTRAKIADNDDNNEGGSTLAATDGKVKANDLAVSARTDGRIESIAVAGAAATSSDPADGPGFFDKAKAGLTGLLAKVPVLGAKLAGGAAGGGAGAAQTEPKFGLAVSGSSAVNLVTLGTRAYLDGATVEHPSTGATSLTVSAVNDTDITAATGSGALTRANNPSSSWSAGIAGSVSVNLGDNSTEAYVEDSTVTNAQDASVTALAGGEQLAVAIGVAVNLSADQTKTASVAGSVSISETDNKVSARLKNSTLTGRSAGSGREVNVVAYDRLKLGTGGGSLIAGGRGGIGAAVTYSEMSNTTEAIIDNATVTQYDDVNAHALTASKIGAGGGMAGGTWADDGGTFGGAFVISDIGNTVNAEVRSSSSITAANQVDILAADTTGIAGLDAAIDEKDGGQPNSESLDYDGTSVGQSASAGSAITSVAGVVQIGKNNVGASFVYNKLHNNFTAAIRSSDVSAGNAGQVGVAAESNAKMLGIGFGVGVATDKFAGSGSLTLSEIDNTVAAEITGAATNTVTAANLTVQAEDKSRTDSFAGNISASFGNGAVGASVSVNNTDNTARAKIENVDINAQQSATVTATNDSKISALAATAGGSKSFAFNGSAAASEINNTTDAFILNAKSDDTGSAIAVNAQDTSHIESLSGGAAFSGSGGGGAGIAVNQISNTTNAYLQGGNYTIKDLLVATSSSNLIRSLAIGIGAGKDVGIGGSVSVNLVDSKANAYVNDGAVVVAQNNVGVTAESDDRITVAAGSAGIGLSAAGIGVSFTVNSITGTTKAYIDGETTRVTGLAKDSADVMSVNSGDLKAGVKLAEKLDVATFDALDIKSNKLKEDVTGVAVNASSSQHVENISANIAGGSQLAVGLVESINVIGGSTQAYVLNALVNDQNTGAGTGQDVAIKASNIAYANSFIGGVSVSGGAAGGVGEDLHTISRTTRAYAAGGRINAIGDVGVTALSRQGVSSIAVGGAVGGLAGVGTLSMAQFNNVTDAYVDSTRVTATGLDIKADNRNDMYLLAGAVSIGGDAAGGAFAVGTSDSTTTATLKNTTGANRVDVSADVNVEAVNDTHIHHIVVSGAGGGGNGIAGMADVNLVTDKTQAKIENSDVGAAADKVGAVHVKATHTLDIDSKSGALGVGLSGGGVGAGASVNIAKAKTTATVNNSNIYSAGLTEVVASSVKHVDATALTAGVGGTVGIGGAAVVTLVGDDVKDESADELNKGGNGTLAGVNSFSSGDRFGELPDSFGPGILADADKTQLNAATNKSTTAVTGSAGGFEFRTAAEVNGTNTVTAGSLDVTATDKTDTKTLVGGFGASLGGGVGGAVAVTSVKANVAANVSGTALTTNGNISIRATAGNDIGKTVDVLALAGAAGIVGLGAAVSYTDITNHVDANLVSGANAGTGAVMVTAEDDSDIDSDAKGAAVGAAAAGIVVSHAAKSSTISASAGDIITASAATISANDQGKVKALGQSAAGGLLGAGSGAKVDASDASTVDAFTLNNASFQLGSGTLRVAATGTPQTEAEADGVAVSGGQSVGASIATATSTANIEAVLGMGTSVTAAQLDVLATRNVGAAPSALATAFGATGGLLLGANATDATASSGGTTSALVGANSTLTVSGTTTVKADSKSQQSSSGLGFSGGIVAVGADFSHAESDTLTQAVLLDDVKVSGNTLQVIATGVDTNYAHGVAGSGGLASAPFSASTTSNISRTYARTGGGNNTNGDARKLDVTSLLVSSAHDANFDAWMENVNASLLGASGAKATHAVNARTEAHIGTSGWIESDNITLAAHNDVHKGGPSAVQIPGLGVNVPTWNVNSSSGGLADVPAAGSNTTIVTNALTQVGANAHLEQTGDRNAPGAFALDAWNDVRAKDRVKMASGGAVSAASGASTIHADTNNATVRIGDFAAVTSVGDMALGARSVADLSTQTSVDVYGLVGVAPAGDSVSSFHSINTIDIAAANMESLHDIKLSAGANTGGTANSLGATARTDVYNNTAIPVNRDPVADAIIGSQSKIAIADGADLAAVRHVSLFSEEGGATASGVGIGKDIYREALAAVASAVSNAFGGGDVSFETRTGRSIKNQTSEVAVDGDVRVGIHRKQELDIGFDGTATKQTDGIKIAATGFRGIAADIRARIDALEKLIALYTVADPTADASIAVAAYRSEIKFLDRKLVELGFPRSDPGTPSFSGVAGISPKQAAQEAVAGMTETRDEYSVQKTTLTDENTSLTNTNATLTGTNTMLSNQNTTLSGQNTTLAATNTALQTQLNALPANDPQRVTLQNQINANNTTIANNSTTINNNTTTINGNTTTINGNVATIGSNNSDIAVLDGQIGSLSSQIGNVQASLAITDTADPDYLSPNAVGGPVAKFLTIGDALAQLGNIYVRGDRLRGGGTLDAPGDAEIKITNNGPSFLILKNLTIPPDEGGKLYFNSIDVKDNTQINGVNGPAGGATFSIFTAESQVDSGGNAVAPGKPQILIESKYDPLDPFYIAQTPANTPTLAPDIILQGDVSNLRGLVKFDSAAGSIRLEQKRDAQGVLILPPETANVRASEVEIKTRNGDFVQSYTDTFFHTAGAPLTTVPGDTNLAFPRNIARIDRTPEVAGKGIVANGSVLIAARYLNINGNIQSGIPEWGVRVPADATVKIGAGSGSFAQAQAHYDALSPVQKAELGAEFYIVSGATVGGLTGNVQGNWEKMSVSYNAKEGRLELGGVRVQGGYIELFGQIFNTNQANGGKLRVMDGYGQVKVENETSMPLWVNLLDTGRGVSGEINITNITGLDANGSPVIGTTTYTRNPGASRTGDFYDPAAGLRYTMTVGYDTARVDYYRYSQKGIFGINILSTKVLDRYKIKSEVRDNDPLAEGVYLRQGPVSAAAYIPASPAVYGANSITGGQQQTRQTDQGAPVPGKSWRDCNWWTLCIDSTHYQEYTVTKGFKTTITDSVKGDYPIGIEYIGFDEGTVGVASTGNVVINAPINNRNGNTSVTSTGSITQNGDLSIVGGNNVVLTAGSGIGASTQSLLVNVNGGKLDATSTFGEVRVGQVVGDLKVGSIGGVGVSNVYVEADRHLLNHDASSSVQGRRVELLSHNGGIGELGDAVNNPLTVKTGYTASQSQWPNNGLMADARDSINIKNVADPGNEAVYSGNLLLIAAQSSAGDVRIETTGTVIDNNPFATTDTFTQRQLADLWDELRLRGPLAQEKADEAVAAYENGRSNNYQLYWQLRNRQANQGAVYDPAFQYAVSQAENDALTTSGLDAAQIAQFATNRTDQYHQLHAEVGGFTNTFTEGFRYEATADEETQIRKGSSWTDAQLALSVGAGLLKNITDTVTTIKEPNAKGRNITLIAGADIGSFDDPLSIDLLDHLARATASTPLTPQQEAELTAEKAALAATERGDATVNGNVITIRQPRPVNVTTGTGALVAIADMGLVFIGSEQDLRIDQIRAADDIRVKTAGSLVNASTTGQANVIGGNMILEAANGGIGAIPDNTGAVSAPLHINPALDSGVIARAAGDIWLDALQDLSADTMFSRGDIRLDAVGSILDFHTGEASITPDINLRSNNARLTAQTGSIGAPGNALDVGVNPDGLIIASAVTFGEGVYLNGPAGESFNIGSVASGDAVALSSATRLKIDGAVDAPGPISLVSGDLLTLTPNADVHPTVLGVFLRAGALTMQDADDDVNAARMRVEVGTVDIETVGDAIITGIETGNPTASAIRVVSTAGRILDGGDTRLDIIADTPPAAQLTISGALGVGDDPLDVRLLNLLATSGGVVDLAVQNSVNILAVTADDRVLLTAGGDITGSAVTSTGTGTTNPDKTISITSATGKVELSEVSGQSAVTVMAPADVNVGAGNAGAGFTLESTGGNVATNNVTANSVALRAPGTVTGDNLNVGSMLNLAANQITANATGTGGGLIGGAMTGYQGGIASNISATLSSPFGYSLSHVATATGGINMLAGDLWVSDMIAVNRVTITNPQSSIVVDQDQRALQPFDAQLYTGGMTFSLGFVGNRIHTDAQVIARRPTHEEVIKRGRNNTSALAQTYEAMAEAGVQHPAEDEPSLPSVGEVVAFTGVPVALEDDERPTCSDESDDTACEEEK